MLAAVVRSGVVESVHDGAVAVVGVDGGLVASSGDIDRSFFLRSAAKPFQAAVAQREGAGLDPQQLAVACASHDGDPVHVALVAAILRQGGLSEADLQCPPEWPLSPAATRRLAYQGHRQPRRLWSDCSGKHAAMLRACRASGLPIETYLSPRHPLQEMVTAMIREVTAAEPEVGVDGCGLPVHSVTARQMALAYARLGSAPELAEVREAMARFPALVSGMHNADADVAVWVGGVAKRGAEGCIGVSLPGRVGVAVKCWDGSPRGAAVGLVAALDALGLLTPAARRGLRAHLERPVLGGGQPVGRVEPTLRLELA